MIHKAYLQSKEEEREVDDFYQTTYLMEIPEMCDYMEYFDKETVTEAINNTAIIGTAMANRRKGKHIITTKVEHASVYEPMYHLEEEGYEVTYLDVDSEGIVDLKQLEESD